MGRVDYVWAMIAALLFSSAPVSYAQNGAAAFGSASFEFNENGNLEGWLANHNGVDRFKVEDGSLQLQLNEQDPFWYAPRPLGLQATPDQTITLRMKVTKGDAIAIYFDTDKYPGLAEYKRIVVPIKADGEFHEYVIKPALNTYWDGAVQA